METTHPTDKFINKADFHKTVVPYPQHLEYPLHLHGPNGAVKVVQSDRERDTALEAGWKRSPAEVVETVKPGPKSKHAETAA